MKGMVMATMLLAAAWCSAAWAQQDRLTVEGFDERGRYYECGWIDWWTPADCGKPEYMERHTGERALSEAAAGGPADEAGEELLSTEQLAALLVELMGEEEALRHVQAALDVEEAGEAPAGPEDLAPPAPHEAADAGLKPWQEYEFFPRDRVAPDAPELFVELLAEPSIDNAVRYWLWYEERQKRLQDAQDLIAEAALVVAARRGEGVPVTYDSGRGKTRTTQEVLAAIGEPGAGREAYSETLR